MIPGVILPLILYSFKLIPNENKAIGTAVDAKRSMMSAVIPVREIPVNENAIPTKIAKIIGFIKRFLSVDLKMENAGCRSENPSITAARSINNEQARVIIGK